MKNLLERLRDALGIELCEQGAAGVLLVHKPDQLKFKITVPYEVLEWFVEAYDDSGTIWSDWADYYAIDGEPREQLASDMQADIARCVTALARAELRVRLEPTAFKSTIERCIDGVWEEVSLQLLTA
ncbi:MAG: hypothetical protein ACJ8GW_19320 [Massilia sp.]